ncbi:hypothetical protein AAL_06613 [Moelleriella libera RCEF 2490]|uniref:Uncharacterized protein n=1 Tax=Moelleriella libera RCEF 2490 TaxID=1081109 RepID=A0A167YI80_9HYPO|nr:hypothetical protein AAL_06613 [Moelleriella libera RCEF 2490]
MTRVVDWGIGVDQPRVRKTLSPTQAKGGFGSSYSNQHATQNASSKLEDDSVPFIATKLALGEAAGLNNCQQRAV